MNRPLFIFSASAMLIAAATGETRTWTSTDGRQLQGEFIKADAKTVTVRKTGDQVVAIPLDKLSEADRSHAGELARQTEEAAKATDKERKEREKREKYLRGPMTYKLSDGSEKWPEDRKKRIVAAMDAGVAFFNEHGKFKKELTANNSPGTPTADASYSGWINWGGTISRRVALHEIAHTLGVGQHENWQKNIKDGKWTGENALKQLREFDGKDAVLHADRQHFWPYGLNQDNESSPQSDLRFIKIVEAMRKDMDIE